MDGMMQHVIVNPETLEFRLVPSGRLAFESIDGCTVIDVADDFTLLGKTVDWNAGTIIDAPPPVPEAVTPAQIRLAILQLGLQSVLDSYVESMDAETRIRWEYSTSVARSDPAVLAAAEFAELSEAQLDGLFILAATLV
jgi:hypothetical protein